MPDFERLPKTIKPVHYKLDLIPNLQDFSIKGSETIDLKVVEATSTINLNCLDIKITSATLNQQKLDLEKCLTYDETNEACSFKLDSELPVGDASLSLEFDAVLNDKLKGSYRSTYKNGAGEEKFCGVTQFESTDARRCFPSWDEPAVKAEFTCSLTIDKNLMCLSNMPETGAENKENDTVKHQYDKSPIMSTYLLAFFVGEADHVTGQTKHGVEVRVFTPLGKKSHGEFALHMGIKCLEYYEDYFNVKYPLPKCDQIGLDDFSAGAMENWGLVTYRSNCLLIDPENSSTATKERVAIVVAHELAHQWFGNLVTMEWWTHLWLNEGFASFMEYLATDAVYPNYNIFDTFVKNDFSMGMSLDALDSSHPTEVDEIFDHISYCKGSSVIRMLHSWIGDKNFRTGMSLYLNRHKYTNALTEDLWAALEEASEMPVGKVMSTWTSQMNFPLVKVEKVSEKKIKISQKKFSANGPGQKTEHDSLWHIPIQICSSNKPQETVKTVVLDSQEMEIEFEEKADWYKLNVGAVGFYRVEYDDELRNALKVDSMMVRDRLQLQSDTFALCKAGYIPMTNYLDTVALYKHETNYAVLSDVLANLSEIGKVCWNLDEATRASFSKWRIEFLQNAKNHCGFEKKEFEDHSTSLLRSSVVSTLGGLGDCETVKWCESAFEKHVSGEKLIQGDLRNAVFGTIAAHAKNVETIDSLIGLWEKNSDSVEEQQNIERAIGLTKNKETIDAVMKWCAEKVRTCNKPYTYVYVCAGSLLGCETFWNLMKSDIEAIKTEFTGFARQAIIARTVKYFGTQDKHDEIKKFFEANKIVGAERAIPQMLENIQNKATILERDGDNIKNYFK